MRETLFSLWNFFPYRVELSFKLKRNYQVAEILWYLCSIENFSPSTSFTIGISFFHKRIMNFDNRCGFWLIKNLEHKFVQFYRSFNSASASKNAFTHPINFRVHKTVIIPHINCPLNCFLTPPSQFKLMKVVYVQCRDK